MEPELWDVDPPHVFVSEGAGAEDAYRDVLCAVGAVTARGRELRELDIRGVALGGLAMASAAGDAHCGVTSASAGAVQGVERASELLGSLRGLESLGVRVDGLGGGRDALAPVARLTRLTKLAVCQWESRGVRRGQPGTAEVLGRIEVLGALR